MDSNGALDVLATALVVRQEVECCCVQPDYAVLMLVVVYGERSCGLDESDGSTLGTGAGIGSTLGAD